MNIDLYCDGGCWPNPGHGSSAFAAILNDELIHEQFFTQAVSTNNIAELTAVIEALEWCKIHYPSAFVNVYVDSEYVRLGISCWIYNWKSNKWKTSGKHPVKNKELWIRLSDLVEDVNPIFRRVRGHDGNKWNEHVDNLCTRARKEKSTI